MTIVGLIIIKSIIEIQEILENTKSDFKNQSKPFKNS